ncbi:hypothetical protein KAI04_03755 [Candidatus Pacearchaeota archaeon]|nr:hypothetical protein [Candidatus Pacearchaeota archaeon]
MQEKREIPEKGGLENLNQLISTLDESILKLEEYYEKKDYLNFDKMKRFILKIFEEIGEIAQ